MSHITKEALLDELIGHCTPYLGHIERYYEALQNLRAALGQPEPMKLTNDEIRAIYTRTYNEGHHGRDFENAFARAVLAAAKGGV